MTTIGDFQTTGIGSLPHHNVDAALEFSFQAGLPFLPQIPIRNPWEYMLTQALEGLPGLQAESDGSATIHTEIWASRSPALERKLAEAFSRPASDTEAFQAFEPSAAACSSWQPFVWELEERGIRLAKIQIAGPLTTQWSVQFKDSTEPAPELAMQIYRLVLARALSMTRRLQAAGVQPLIYVDEPGLYGLTSTHPKHALGLRELGILIQSLRKEDAIVGLHCCSNTDWDAVLGLGLDVVSLDTNLSLRGFLTPERSGLIRDFLERGGRLSLGVIPTARSSVLRSLDVKTLFSELMISFQVWKDSPALIRKTLTEAIYTPACGLALHSVSDADLVLGLLTEFRDLCAVSVGGRI